MLAAGAFAVLLVAVILVITLGHSESARESHESAPVSGPISKKDVLEIASERGLERVFWMGDARAPAELRADLNQDDSLTLAYLSPKDVKILDQEPTAFKTLVITGHSSASELRGVKEKLRSSDAESVPIKGGAVAKIVREKGVIRRVIILGEGGAVGELISDDPPFSERELSRSLRRLRSTPVR